MVNYHAKVAAGVGLLLLALIVGCGGEDKDLSNQERQQIASTLEGFVEAFGNADTTALGSYWSQSCTAEERVNTNLAATFFATIFGADGGGGYDLKINVDKLAIEVVDGQHVMVPLEQPEGAVSATATVLGEAAPMGEPLALVVEVPIRFVDEDGSWKVESCVLSVNEPEDEEEQIPLSTTSP